MEESFRLSVLITAGGTRENIDTVRSITNHSTGRLGSLMADTFSRQGARVTFLRGEASVLPASPDCEIISIQSAAQLIDRLEDLLHTRTYDCVIHAMAVSDFSPHRVMTVDEAAELIAGEIINGRFIESEMRARVRDVLLNGIDKPVDKKISSQASSLLMVLRQNPKVIERIKSIQPKTLLVGFKLLSGASEQALLAASRRLISRNNCDYVVANDLDNIAGDRHRALLIDENGILGSAETKPEIAQMVYKTVWERKVN